MALYKVKLEGVFFKMASEEGSADCGLIGTYNVQASHAVGALERAKGIFLRASEAREGLASRQGLFKSYVRLDGIWEIDAELNQATESDPGFVFYRIHFFDYPRLLLLRLFSSRPVFFLGDRTKKDRFTS